MSIARRRYRRFRTPEAAGSCTNFCVNVCTTLYTVGVQQCINDCLACSGSTTARCNDRVFVLSDHDYFDDDEDEM